MGAGLGTQGPVAAPEPDGKHRTRWSSQAQVQVGGGLSSVQALPREVFESVEKHSESKVGERENSPSIPASATFFPPSFFFLRQNFSV